MGIVRDLQKPPRHIFVDAEATLRGTPEAANIARQA
jgi:hypothetical protein